MQNITTVNTEQRICDFLESLDERGKIALMLFASAMGAEASNGCELKGKIVEMVEAWEKEPTCDPGLQWIRGVVDGIESQNAA